MKVQIFASGSSGNCLLISNGDTNILIDAGISMRRVENSLAQANLKLRDIRGVLITHEHSDHVSGLKMLIKHSDIRVFAPRTVAARLRGTIPEIDTHLVVIPVRAPFWIGNVRITAFHTPHDTDESVGYRIQGQKSFAVATDMGCVTDEVETYLTGADAVLIESNHDIEMLKYGRYPVYLKRRILSDRGHLSNTCCAELAQRLAKSGTKQIILGHLSGENNRPEYAIAASRDALIGLDVQIFCAPIQGCLEIDVGDNEKCSV